MSTSTFASTEGLSSHYDFVVVGGGQAGIVVACRLSEDPHRSVLLLEAGSDHLNDPLVLTPPFARQMQANDNYDWHFKTTDQTELAGRQVIHHRGKGLGGSSSINFNMIVVPSKASLDSWRELGNSGWGFDAMAPYYRKFHTFHEPSPETSEKLGLDYLDKSVHGTTGPIQVGYGAHPPPLNTTWTKTFAAVGYTPKHDPFTGEHFGGYNTPCSIDPTTSNRSYAAAYLNDDVLRRRNLRIVTEARVEMLVLAEISEKKQAISGVRFVNKENQKIAVESTEVVLSAGAFQSPQLLELSGIGDSALLESKGIIPRVHLPGVGENLQDHSNVGVSFESKDATFDSFRDPAIIGAAVKEYQTSKSGPLAVSALGAAYLPCMELLGPDGSAKLATMLDKHISSDLAFPAQKEQYRLIKSTLQDPARSSIEYLFAPVQMNEQQSGGAIGLDKAAKETDYITIFASLSHPFSRGNVHIISSDPSAKPAIDPKYFSHPLDVEIVARHLMYLETLTKTEPLASLLKADGRRIPEKVDLTDLETARETVKTGFTTYHPCGTCAMMPLSLGGVVDERLKVHGVEGLRVVDASIFPLIPRGNLMATVYAVAEKAADLIKEDWTH